MGLDNKFHDGEKCMAFYSDRNYVADNGTIFQMRVDRNDLFPGNTQGAGSPVAWIPNRRSSRTPGLSVRQFVIRVAIVEENPQSGIPAVYRYRKVTVLQKSTFDAGTIGDVIPFNGGQYLLHKKLAEINSAG
jgi:hypothetical protein